jgi:hypothetical protein
VITFKESNDQDNVTLTELPIGDDRLTIEIGSPIPPAQLFVSLFSTLDSKGVPVDSIGDERDCLERENPCDMTISKTTIRIGIPDTSSARIVVVHLGYWGEPAAGLSTQDLFLYTVSWGARLIRSAS